MGLSSASCRLAVTFCALGALAGCSTVKKTVTPSNHRDWVADQAVLPTAEFSGDRVTVRNVRYCKHLDEGEYVVDHADREFDLSKLRAVDFVTMPFGPVPALAHTMVSFEFEPDLPGEPPAHLAVSVEVRKEKGEETFNPLLGMAQQYEIMYVVADEHDLLHRQAVVYDGPTYLYRTTATPEAGRELLVDMLGRANELAERPEFYDLLTNNCTTNIARHINRIRPNRLVYDLGVLLPGYSDQKAYQEGLLAAGRAKSFDELKAEALINSRARLAKEDGSDFSEVIRR